MNIRRNITAGVAGVLLTAGMAAPAFAAIDTVNVEGGFWTRGTGEGKVVSNYYHDGRYHASSVRVGRGEGRLHKSGCTKPKAWSKVSADDSIWRDEAYYSFCD